MTQPISISIAMLFEQEEDEDCFGSITTRNDVYVRRVPRSGVSRRAYVLVLLDTIAGAITRRTVLPYSIFDVFDSGRFALLIHHYADEIDLPRLRYIFMC